MQGHQLKLEVLAVLEFNSDRKRMSVLCRLPDGRLATFPLSFSLFVLSVLSCIIISLMRLPHPLFCLRSAVFWHHLQLDSC